MARSKIRSDRGARTARRAGGPGSWLGAAAAFGVAACAPLPPPQDKLAEQIASYYAHHASEEGGQCAAPEIASVTRRKVLASSAEATTLRVCYSYFDASAASAATDWTRVLQAERPCTGFAERDFTLARGPLGYQVVEMSGPVREEP